MDEQGNWIGGNDVLVQTGDIIDRGDHSKEIYDMLFKLQDQAPTRGGEVRLLLGNHELMHMQGDLRYMTEVDAQEFGGMGSCDAAFGPDGWLGSRLRQRAKVLELLGPEQGLPEAVVYVHGGLLANVAEHFGRPRVALAQRQSWQQEGLQAGLQRAASLNEAFHSLLAGRGQEELSADTSALFGEDGPLWTRYLALGAEPCGDLDRTLQLLNATRMIVGHTAQEDGNVHSRCGGRLVLADTLISEAYTGTSHPSAVELAPDGRAYALYPTRGSSGVREELPHTAVA